jgi:hypothetical protein
MSLEKSRFIALGLLLAVTVAAAQPHVHQTSPAKPVVASSSSAEVGRDPPYKSVLKDYRRFDGDLPLRDWREANRTVHERGGWRAYAKEAAAAAAEPAKEKRP